MSTTELEQLRQRVAELEAKLAAVPAVPDNGLEKLSQAYSLVEAAFEATADGILVVSSEGRISRYNRRFLELWRIPDDIAASHDDERLLGYVIRQLADPEQFISKVRELYATPEAESFDTLEFADGRIFDRYSCPQRLEGRVAGRVWSFRDVTAQAAAERERSAYQEQLIAAQRATLEELSTPLIPISDQVMIMPLIGTIDTGRARRVMETLLEGVAAHNTRLVIIDITGVALVDTQVANVLMQSAQAVELLGTQVILTGVRPEVAQLIVGLGIDLSRLLTYGSLQQGVQYALRQQRRQ
jgi:rsbT co-antagonist protein RsbR